MTFTKRVEKNVNSHFANQYFTSKHVARKMKVRAEKVSNTLSSLHNTGRIKLVGYTKSEHTGCFLNVYQTHNCYKCLWWLKDPIYKNMEV